MKSKNVMQIFLGGLLMLAPPALARDKKASTNKNYKTIEQAGHTFQVDKDVFERKEENAQIVVGTDSTYFVVVDQKKEDVGVTVQHQTRFQSNDSLLDKNEVKSSTKIYTDTVGNTQLVLRQQDGKLFVSGYDIDKGISFGFTPIDASMNEEIKKGPQAAEKDITYRLENGQGNLPLTVSRIDAALRTNILKTSETYIAGKSGKDDTNGVGFVQGVLSESGHDVFPAGSLGGAISADVALQMMMIQATNQGALIEGSDVQQLISKDYKKANALFVGQVALLKEKDGTLQAVIIKDVDATGAMIIQHVNPKTHRIEEDIIVHSQLGRVEHVMDVMSMDAGKGLVDELLPARPTLAYTIEVMKNTPVNTTVAGPAASLKGPRSWGIHSGGIIGGYTPQNKPEKQKSAAKKTGITRDTLNANTVVITEYVGSGREIEHTEYLTYAGAVPKSTKQKAPDIATKIDKYEGDNVSFLVYQDFHQGMVNDSGVVVIDQNTGASVRLWHENKSEQLLKEAVKDKTKIPLAATLFQMVQKAVNEQETLQRQEQKPALK